MTDDIKYTLRVKHSVTIHEDDVLNETGYLISYEVLETNISDLPPELFLFRRVLGQRIDRLPYEELDNFVTVCTLSDVFEYPANAPDCNKPYFRKSIVKGVLPTLEEANRVLFRIEDLLTSLLRSVKLIQEVATEVEREITI